MDLYRSAQVFAFQKSTWYTTYQAMETTSQENKIPSSSSVL